MHIERSLCIAVATGDEKAFRRLFEYYWDAVYSVALAFTKSRAIAEEMVQDIFLKIWIRREKLAAVENFQGYLFIIARNHILNELRKKIKEVPFAEHLVRHFQELAPSPETLLLFKEYEETLKKALEELPLQQRRIFQLSREKGMSQEEIASTLRISKHTVKSHMNKALRAVRHYLRMHAGIESLLIFWLAFQLAETSFPGLLV